MLPNVSKRARRFGGLLALTLAASSLAGVPAYGIAGGSPATAEEFPFLAHLAIGGEQACSGALVATSWIVTAGDCFADSGDFGAPAQNTTVTVGRSDLTADASGRVRTVIDLVRHPERNVILARLDAPVPDITPVAITGTAPVVGDTLRGAGYGRTATEWVPGHLSSAAFSIDSLTDALVNVVGADGSDAATCKGDAGGPLFRGEGSAVRLVALNTASWQNGCLGSTETRQGGTAARLDTIAGWISRNTVDPQVATTRPPNYSFEAGLAGWNQYAAGGNTASTDRAYEGGTSAKVVDTSSTAASGLESTRMPAVPGVEYTATAWVNVTSGTPSLYVRFFDAAGHVLLSTSTDFAGDPLQWTRMQIADTAPAGTARVGLLVYITQARTGTTYFDQVDIARAAALPVANGGFENGLTGWSDYGSGGSTASTDRSYEGVASAKIVDTSSTTGTGLEGARFPAVVGVGYTASARMFRSTNTSTAPALYMRFYNDAGDLVGNASTSAPDITGQWTQARATGITPAGATQVAVLLYSFQASTGTTYFDQVELRRAADVTVPDHGFENGLAGWSQYGEGGNATSTDGAYEGTTSARITDDSTTTPTGLESPRMPAVEGVSYTAMAFMYVESGSPSIYVRYFNASGDLLTSSSADFSGVPEEWTPLQVTATAPAGTESMSVLLYSKLKNTGTTYADQVVIH